MGNPNLYSEPPFVDLLLRTPAQWVPCVMRLTAPGPYLYGGNYGPPREVRDYLIRTWDDLYLMSLWILDYMAGNLQVPHTMDYFGLPDEATGHYAEDEHAGAISQVSYNRFQAIRRARHGEMAWRWLQWNHRTLESWKISFTLDINLRVILPVPTDPPPSPITWLTPP